MSKHITPKTIDQVFDGVEIPDDRTVRKQTAIKKRELAGWKDKNSQRLLDPSYLEKLSESQKNSQKFQSARQKIKQNPARHSQAIKQGLSEFFKNNPDHKEKVVQRNKEQSKDLNWLNAVTNGNQKRSSDPEHRKKMADVYKSQQWKQNHAQSLITDEYKHNHLNGINQSVSKPMVIKSIGVFASKAMASEYYLKNKILPTRTTLASINRYLGEMLKKDPNNFFLITYEEYKNNYL